jgi:imidazolonepropionase-like amidohydrolase
MDWTEKTGSVDAGKWADIIAVDGNPLSDVKLLQDVKFVMKAGRSIKASGSDKKTW